MLTGRIILAGLAIAVLYAVRNALLDRVKSEERYERSRIKKGQKVIERMKDMSENKDNGDEGTEQAEKDSQNEE